MRVTPLWVASPDGTRYSKPVVFVEPGRTLIAGKVHGVATLLVETTSEPTLRGRRMVGVDTESGTWSVAGGVCGSCGHPLRSLTVDQATTLPRLAEVG